MVESYKKDSARYFDADEEQKNNTQEELANSESLLFEMELQEESDEIMKDLTELEQSEETLIQPDDTRKDGEANDDNQLAQSLKKLQYQKQLTQRDLIQVESIMAAAQKFKIPVSNSDIADENADFSFDEMVASTTVDPELRKKLSTNSATTDKTATYNQSLIQEKLEVKRRVVMDITKGSRPSGALNYQALVTEQSQETSSTEASNKASTQSGGNSDADALMQKEVTDYISQMFMLITTGNEKMDREFMGIITDQIFARVRFMSTTEGVEPPSKKIIYQFLENIREEFMVRSAENQNNTSQTLVRDAAIAVFRSGIMTTRVSVQTLNAVQGVTTRADIASSLTSAPWLFTGIILAAKTGVDYRQLRKGKINKREFKRRLRTNTVSRAASLTAATIGATAGFALGTVIIPGVGTAVGGIIGTFVGAISIGFIGKRQADKGYAKIEDQIEARYQIKMMREQYFEQKKNDLKISVLKDQIVEENDYKRACELLNAEEGSTEEETPIEELENRFETMFQSLQAQLESIKKQLLECPDNKFVQEKEAKLIEQMQELSTSWDLMRARKNSEALDDWQDLKYVPGTKKSVFKKDL